MKQLTVITTNEPGPLADISTALADEGINIEDIEANAHGDHGVVLLTVALDDYDRALQTLQERTPFRVFTEDSIVIRVEDRPGALAEIAMRFKESAVNVRSMHIIERGKPSSLASIVVDDRAKAEELLQDILVYPV